ncbi:MAG: polysaccharide deacetylase family protein, partial [Chloroflexaceae bacterium]|nr:polysaccharide deacetylase family protein [Chloroflexaceae bacterium]
LVGGLVHSRSVGDPFADEDPEIRGMRMRQGITTTLELFERYDVAATFYANGYALLPGNPSRTEFMGNPTYTWANRANQWTSDHWQMHPWFSADPYGNVLSHPAWYFADLVRPVLEAGHDIQSHTFSHFYGGFVRASDWHDDLNTWNKVAMQIGVQPARSLAFPWSSSGGMSDGSWQELAAAGMSSVTRLSNQGQYDLFGYNAAGMLEQPHCRPVPGHEAILACPDAYVTPGTVAQALEQLALVRLRSGMIDFWSHTEEVVTAEQQAAWEQILAAVVGPGDIWVAPLAEIADWQQALAQVTLETQSPGADGGLQLRLYNGSERRLEGLTLQLPWSAGRVMVDGREIIETQGATDQLIITIDAGQTQEIAVWPAT